MNFYKNFEKNEKNQKLYENKTKIPIKSMEN